MQRIGLLIAYGIHVGHVRHMPVLYRNKESCGETICPAPIAFGCGHSLPCCPHTNAFETATHAFRRLAKNQKTGQTDRQTDERTNGPRN